MKDIFKPLLLQGKTAFITGGTSGINLAIAERFAAQGASVALVGRDAGKAGRAAATIAAQGGEAVGLSADVRDMEATEAALRAAVDAYGQIDVIIAGAAGNFVAPALAMSANGFRTVVDIDLIGTFNTLRAGFAHLRKPGATAIAISAVQGQMPTAAQPHVCAAKAGVEMLVRTLAIEWADRGVRSLAIAPGPVEETEGMRRLAPGGEASLRRILDSVPSGRQAQPREIADLALFLVSGAADYVNGAVIPIDGGLANVGSLAFGSMLTEAHRNAGERPPRA